MSPADYRKVTVGQTIKNDAQMVDRNINLQLIYRILRRKSSFSSNSIVSRDESRDKYISRIISVVKINDKLVEGTHVYNFKNLV